MNTDRSIAISWAIHAMKDVIGRQIVRKNIITMFVPKIKNAKQIRTFDAFQQYKTAPYDNKKIKILTYCANIIKRKSVVVFTASNIQENAEDMETHYQSYIVDNKNKILFAIDPAINPKTKSGFGIYKPMVTTDIIQPFFEANKYRFQFVKLSNPAQTTKDDVFCQSWSLYILLALLDGPFRANRLFANGEPLDGHVVPNESVVPKGGGERLNSGDAQRISKEFDGGNDAFRKTVTIPKSKIDKYAVLLDFYKKILVGVDGVADELNQTFVGYINDDDTIGDIIENGGDVVQIIQMKASDIILDMSPSDMKE